MKRIFAGVLILVSLCWAVEARFPRGTPSATPNPNLREQNVFGLKGSAWQDTANYNSPGVGSPAVSTADYYHGPAYWMKPFDLTQAACGSVGASIAAANGRYLWMANADHADLTEWMDSNGLFLGFSNDPGVLPSRMSIFYPRHRTTAVAKIADVTASISGNSLIVTAVTGAGNISYENSAIVTGSGVTQARITGQVSGTSGSTGTYTINGAPQTVGSQAMVVSQTDFSLGGTPYPVCNPDDPSFTFYVYAEGAAPGSGLETGVTKSNDLVTWTDATPAMVNNNFSNFAGYMRVVRNGVNDWYATGFTGGFPGGSGGGYGYGKWTSTDGVKFVPPASALMNACVPANIGGITGNQPCTAATALFQNEAGTIPKSFTIAAQDWGVTHSSSTVSGVRQGNQWVARAPIDSNFNVLQTPSIVNISSPYDGIYPGPGYVNAVSGYVEDGVSFYYADIGFPGNVITGVVANARYANGGACFSVPPANGSYGYFAGNGSISGTTLTVNSVATNSIVVGGQIAGGSMDPTTKITAQLTGTAGGPGTYTVSTSQTAATTNFVGYSCGSLLQQAVDIYSEVVDAAAAAGAAPAGVKASCAASTATLTWFNALPQQTYRLYRGTTAGSQPTLVGDFTGVTATDTGMTLNALTYYKLVYLHSGVEQKNRVVSTWCSASSSFVNAHMTRASLGGADMSTCNRTVLDAVDGWLVSNGLSNNLLFGKMVQFCVAKNGSNQISKIFDIGTTRLPRGGDYTPVSPTLTTYNATGINGNPAWSNSSNVAWGYYGGGRFNNIRQKSQVTAFSAYKKSHAFQVTPLSIGQGTGMVLYHSAGSPGAANFLLSDATQTKTATGTITGLATDFHTLTGTFDGATLTVYADAVAGTGTQTGLVIPSPKLSPSDILTGQVGAVNVNTNMNVLVSGSTISKYSYALGYQFSDNQSQLDGAGDFLFDKALSASQVSSFHTLIKTTIYGL